MTFCKITPPKTCIIFCCRAVHKSFPKSTSWTSLSGPECFKATGFGQESGDMRNQNGVSDSGILDDLLPWPKPSSVGMERFEAVVSLSCALNFDELALDQLQLNQWK